MYLIDRKNNICHKIEEKKFSELGFRERDHLQEWLAADPSMFSEDLLIIQKEFDGFSDTKERLDLLALDKRGNIGVESGNQKAADYICYAYNCYRMDYFFTNTDLWAKLW